MKKIFANFILIFTIFFNTSVFADKIDSIKIIGNKRVSNETILLFSKISKNSEITNENELNNIFKNLYETNFFSDIKISFENSILTIVVEENPIIQKVEFKGIKSNKLQESVYKNLILKNKSSFVKRIAKKDIKCAFIKVWAYIDITKDDRLSVAEIARFQRNIVKFAAAGEGESILKTEDFAAIQLASIIFLPITASSVLNSFDYDNDGLLSKNEVLGDTEFSKLVGINLETFSTGFDFRSLGKKLQDSMNLIPLPK